MRKNQATYERTKGDQTMTNAIVGSDLDKFVIKHLKQERSTLKGKITRSRNIARNSVILADKLALLAQVMTFETELRALDLRYFDRYDEAVRNIAA